MKKTKTIIKKQKETKSITIKPEPVSDALYVPESEHDNDGMVKNGMIFIWSTNEMSEDLQSGLYDSVIINGIKYQTKHLSFIALAKQRLISEISGLDHNSGSILRFINKEKRIIKYIRNT